MIIIPFNLQTKEVRKETGGLLSGGRHGMLEFCYSGGAEFSCAGHRIWRRGGRTSLYLYVFRFCGGNGCYSQFYSEHSLETDYDKADTAHAFDASRKGKPVGALRIFPPSLSMR